MGRKVKFTKEEKILKHRKVSYAYYLKKKLHPDYVKLQELKKQEKEKIKESKKKIKEYIQIQHKIQKEDRVISVISKITKGEFNTAGQLSQKYNVKPTRLYYIIGKLIKEKGEENIDLQSMIDYYNDTYKNK